MADLYYDKVALLLPMNGADGGSTFTDWSSVPKTVTRSGDAHTETDQFKFYDSSAYFDGNGDYLTAALALIPTTGDFTLELWVRLNALTTTQCLASQKHDISNNDGRVRFYVEATTGKVILFVGGTGGFTLTSTHGIAATTWTHVAVTRSSNVFRLFINGAVEATSGTQTITLENVATRIGLYVAATADYLAGYVQDLRITSLARYTEAFTPPGKLIGAISGTVYDANGDPAARKIVAWPRAIHPPTTSVIYSTTSSAGDGSYSLTVPDTEISRVVLADETTLYNDLVHRVLPG